MVSCLSWAVTAKALSQQKQVMDLQQVLDQPCCSVACSVGAQCQQQVYPVAACVVQWRANTCLHWHVQAQFLHTVKVGVKSIQNPYN